MEERRVTIVQYDLTSSEDERDPDQTYVYSSSKLSPLSASEFLCEPSAEENDSDKSEQNSVLLLESDSSSASDAEEGPGTSASKRPRLSDGASSDFEIVANTSAAPAPIYVASSSESEDQDREAPDLGRKPYSTRLQELPAELREFLAETNAFFTSPHRLERAGQRVTLTTYGKAQERIMCFLGYVIRCHPKQPLTPDVFDRARLLESYLDHLKDHRCLSAATISNHASSLLYPLKYIYRREAPNYANVPIIAQLRRMATLLQRQGDVQRPKTREDLRALNKWVDWDEVLEATSLQRSRFEVARTKRHRAREAADFLLLSLYVHIPPSRGLEIRTLETVDEATLGEPFTAARFANRNVALLQNDGGITIYVQNYKTSKFAGSDTVPIQADSELCRFFRRYVREFRQELSTEEKNDYLFVNANGQPYSGTNFSKHVKNLMVRLTGREASINTLRSSFLTWAYSQSECDDSMKDSLAAALRHSREQAQSTYDRRTAYEKKAAALRLARQKAEEGPDTDALPAAAQQSCEPEVNVGQFVGLVAEDSTLQKPSVFLGRVQAFLPDGQVCLLWYRNSGGGLYTLEVDGSQWSESVQALVPVKVAVAKGRSNAYRLLTSVRTIHKAVHGVARDS